MADALTDILRAASKHPNSRVSKLIHIVEEEPSQKNIVLLLIELAEHAEYSIDFNISLKYYLDFFERLGINHDLVLNEAGLLLVNSSKIYSKRVDYVQSLVERQILTLSNADAEIQQLKLDQQQQDSQNGNATPSEKPKRGRKRALDAPSDPYEIELVPKKFKKLTEEKRFAMVKQTPKPKSVLRNIELEQHIHPAGWLHATIYDFENEEDVDTKRNYKLFTYHIEHRHNTLVPDINFRLHFKVKDYMDEQEEMDNDNEAFNTDRSWPPLSEAYVQKYIRLENYVLQQEIETSKRKHNKLECFSNNVNAANSKKSKLCDTEDAFNTTAKEFNATLSKNNDTGMGESLLDETYKCLDASQLESIAKPLELASNTESLKGTTLAEADQSLNTIDNQQENDSALGTSLLDQTNTIEINNTTSESNKNLSTISTNSNDTSQTETQQVNDSKESASILDQSNNTEANDSGLSAGLLDQSDNIETNTTEESKSSSNLNSTTLSESTEANDTGLSAGLLDQSNNSEINTTAESNSNSNLHSTTLCEGTEAGSLDQTENTEINTAAPENISENTTHLTADMSDISNTEINGITNATKTVENQTKEKILKVGEESNLENQEAILKTTENLKDSAVVCDDEHQSIFTENMALSTEHKNDIDLKMNAKQNEENDPTQLRIRLPHNDDEGVYLSDIEEQDCRLLSPVIKTVNILPGVVSKDVTIYMDEELRKALDMRDGIMEHFGTEIYKIPIIAQPAKHKLIFNIFKLPEKLLRKKVLFKLGPEMDLFLKARCFKRSKPEPINRSLTKYTPLQWFPLNDTDMTGVCMTPPYSPGHCSDFYGFTDDEEDTISCSDFCGFTEEEQVALQLKNIHRLSRDSGVGVDVNNLTPDKEPMNVIFESAELSQAIIDNCKKNLNFDQISKDTMETLLNQLPAEIRDVLTAELDERGLNEKQDASGSTVGDNTECNNVNNSEEKSCTENIAQSTGLKTNDMNNTQETENLATQREISENNTQEIDVPNTENNLENREKSLNIESQENENTNLKSTQETENLTICSDTKQRTENAEQQEPSEIQLISENKTSENLSNILIETPCDINNENDDSQDDMMLDLNTQGTKTKIQQWHEHLQPILAKSRERHHFDVFQLGTEIIDTVQSTKKSNNEISGDSTPVGTFQDIMENKDQSYVSRYFLSTLLLANQNNIEISIDNKSSEEPSSWQDIHLRLLSTKRHTVAIEDNIGLIDKTKQTKASCQKESKDIKNSKGENDNEEDDGPLSSLQNTIKSHKKSSAIKRIRDNSTSTPLVVKKPKENSAPSGLIIQSIEYIPAPLASSINITPLPLNIMPSTSHQAVLNNACHVNLNAVRTLQPIEKVQKRYDDLDSGIFSIDEISISASCR